MNSLSVVLNGILNSLSAAAGIANTAPQEQKNV